MFLTILSPNKKIFEGKAREVTLPGKEGQFQILEGHCPLFAVLGKGKIIVDRKKEIFILSGITEVQNDAVFVLVKSKFL